MGMSGTQHSKMMADRACTPTSSTNRVTGASRLYTSWGQVLGKVGVDLFHAFTGQHDHLAGGGGLGVIGAQTGQLVVNVAAQSALDVLGSLVAHAGCQQGEREPERYRAQTQQKVLPQHPGGEHARKGRPHQPGDGPHKDHVAQHAQPLERHVGPPQAQGPAVKGEQIFC